MPPFCLKCRTLTGNLTALVVAPLLFLVSCGPDDPVLARIGDSEITETDLDEFVDRLPERMHSTRQGAEADREHLNSMLDREFLLLEAAARGLDTAAAVTRELNEEEQERLSQRYRREVIAPRVQVGPEDMERGFRDMGFDRERLLSRILVKGGERDARAVLKQLEAGADFADLAREYAANDPSADETGKIGWVGLTGLRPFLVQQPEFLSLAIGQPRLYRLSPGIWQIVRFEADREAKIETYAAEIRQLVMMEQMWRRTQEEIEILRQTYGTRYHPEAVQALIRRVVERRRELEQEEARQPLYTFADGDAITAGEFLTRIRRLKGSAAVTDSALIVDKLAEKEVLHPYLFVKEAHRRGWHQESDFVAWRDHLFAGLMLDELMRSEVEEAPGPTEEELRAYYDDHQEEFRVGTTVSIEEVHVKDEATARQLRDDILSGVSFAEILQRPGVASYGKYKKGGTMSVQSHLTEHFPELAESALAAPAGEVVGPIHLKESERYSVLRVIERQESGIHPFDEARKAVGHALRVAQRDELLSALFESVRAKYENRVVVFDDRLEQRHIAQ